MTTVFCAKDLDKCLPAQRALARIGFSRVGALIVTRRASGLKVEYFEEPSERITALGSKDVADNLSRLQELSASHFLFGWFSYELGGVLERSLVHTETGQPLFDFHAFDRPFFLGELTQGFEARDWKIYSIRPEIDSVQYSRQIDRIHREIRRGNVYQVNLTFKLKFRFEGDPRSLFLSLNRSQPVPYSLLSRDEDTWILSHSPELFFKLQPGNEIAMEPMKGTAMRGRNVVEDQLYKEALKQDEKNRAENLMIVDLIRNDLGRISETGTVAVSNLFRVQKLRTLFQMTSHVKACLSNGWTLENLLRAVFPCGSITGAPKIAAMRLIHELENSPRGIYCGAVGHFAPNGCHRFNVGIRTIKLERRTPMGERSPSGDFLGEMGVGSGIVIDSSPGDEWRECISKATFLTKSYPRFRLLETLLLRDCRFLRLEAHLRRLAESAEYFEFPVRLADIRKRLNAVAGELRKGSWKIRLLVDEDGKVEIDRSPLRPLGESPSIALAVPQSDSQDPFFFHKTTHRTLYERAQKVAKAEGFWDLIFCNEKGEITEGAISNIFMLRGQSWLTPPVDCGVLPGVMRAQFIQRFSAEEVVLGPEDLFTSDALVVTNSVRGILSATLSRQKIDF